MISLTKMSKSLTMEQKQRDDSRNKGKRHNGGTASWFITQCWPAQLLCTNATPSVDLIVGAFLVTYTTLIKEQIRGQLRVCKGVPSIFNNRCNLSHILCITHIHYTPTKIIQIKCNSSRLNSGQLSEMHLPGKPTVSWFPQIMGAMQKHEVST